VPEGAHQLGPYRLIPSSCQIDKLFVSNGKFKYFGGESGYFIDGKLGFAGGDEKPDGTYKSIIFPCWYNSAVVYAADDAGLEKAFNYRLGCVRVPEVPGYHEFLITNQLSYFRDDWEMEFFKNEFAAYLATWFDGYDDLDYELKLYAEQPHAKRKMRMRALRSILTKGDWYHRTFNRRVTGKVKRAELAKNLKATRLINDLTCEGSLLCGFVADQIKKAMAKFTADKWYSFIKSPNLVDLTSVFKKLVNPEGQLYFPFFSDDSCVSIRCSDGIFMANVDISSCDGSHTKAIFNFLRAVTRHDSRLFRFVDGAIKQCEMPLSLLSGATSKRVVLKPTSPVLYSGSTLTTLINNFANIAIAFAIKTRLQARADITKAECKELVRFAAEAAGYIVTVDVCDTYHDLQFLKHSPCLNTQGEMVPVLNLGVMLRSFGSCWGDVPTFRKQFGSKLSFRQRRFLWNVAQVQCYKNCVTHPFLSALRSRFRHHEEVVGRHESWVVSNITVDHSGHGVTSS
jgi:hypothetical protein